MNEQNWKELKEHAIKQEEQARKLNNNAGKLLAHVWKDVRNKMWSIQKKNGKNKN